MDRDTSDPLSVSQYTNIPNETVVPKKSTTRNRFIILLFLLPAVLIIVIGHVFFDHPQLHSQNGLPVNSISISMSPRVTIPSPSPVYTHQLLTLTYQKNDGNMMRYRNKTFGYSLQYPASWSLDTSRAESILNKSEFCYYNNQLHIIPPEHNGYLLLRFGPDCLGGQPEPFVNASLVSVDGVFSEEIFGGDCEQVNGPCAGNGVVNYIKYEAPPCDITKGTAKTNWISCNYLKIHNQTIQMYYSFYSDTVTGSPNGVRTNSQNFQFLLEDIHSIVSSLTTPEIPLHPEIK